MLLKSKSRHKRHRRSYKKWFLILVLGATVCLFAPDAYRSARQSYLDWKRDRALDQARKAFVVNDYPKAAIAMQVALRADRLSPKVWRTIADMSEAAGAREAILQRQQVVQLTHGAFEDQLALALTALRFGDLFIAQDALGAIPPDRREDSNYMRVAALYSMMAGEGGVAEALLSKLIKLDQGDAVRITLATVRMSSPDPAVSTGARQELAGMAQNPKMALRALRELMGDAILRSDWPAARAWAERLAKLPDAAFSDRLGLATLLLLREKKPLDELLPDLKVRAAKSPGDAVMLVRWLHDQKQSALALAWLDSLPVEMRDNALVKTARLEMAFAQKDWAGAGELLHENAAGPIPDDVLRLAMEARAVADVGGADAVRFSKWQQVLAAAHGNLGAYRILYRLTAAWKWEPEAEALLQTVAREFPGQTWAHEALVRVYQDQRDAPNLLKILAVWQQQQPDVRRLQNDWALMDMIVSPTPSWGRSKQVAEDLYKSEPSNAYYATACALAYAQAERAKDAVVIVEKLKPAERQFPLRAPYLAFVYAEAGMAKEAREQIKRTKFGKFYKEELKLVELAQKKADELERQDAEIRRLTGASTAPAVKGTDKQ